MTDPSYPNPKLDARPVLATKHHARCLGCDNPFSIWLPASAAVDESYGIDTTCISCTRERDLTLAAHNADPDNSPLSDSQLADLLTDLKGDSNS